jgi:uncharacterized protein YecE (DUF72 family)
VYSAPKGIDYLAEYAQRYDCVEVDRWFWSLFAPDKVKLPDPRDVERYRIAVPEGFRFALKAPNALTLTHFYRKARSDPLVANPHFLSDVLLRRFVEQVEGLGDLLGPIMFQFEYLNRRKMPSRDVFFGAVERFAVRLPQGFTYALETRNPQYIDDAYFAFLQAMGWAPVLISGYWMPPLIQLLDAHAEALRGFDTVVVRLLGPDREGIEQQTTGSWDRIVEPRDDELDALATRLHDLVRLVSHPFLFVNNHYEGSAPLTIERLMSRSGIRYGV